MHMLIFSLLAGLDLLITYIWLPSQSEANLVAGFLYLEFGFVALILLKAMSTLFIVLVIIFLQKIKYRWVSMQSKVLVGLAFIPVVWNLWVLSTG